MADYEYRTAVTRLRASEEVHALLERTLSDWHEACQLATERAWPHTTDARTIQSMSYDAIREQTELGSQHAILATKQVASALKTCADRREKGLTTSKPRFRAPTLTYDARCLSLFEDGTVSLATVDGRVRCDLCLPRDEGYQHQFLDDEAWSLTESTLSLRTTRATFVCQRCGASANADYNAAKSVAMRAVRDGQQSSSRTGTCRCALKSGTVNPNGTFHPYPTGSEEESADESAA